MPRLSDPAIDDGHGLLLRNEEERLHSHVSAIGCRASRMDPPSFTVGNHLLFHEKDTHWITTCDVAPHAIPEPSKHRIPPLVLAKATSQKDWGRDKNDLHGIMSAFSFQLSQHQKLVSYTNIQY